MAGELVADRQSAPQKKRKTRSDKFVLDLKLIEVLAEAGCSIEETAAMLRRSGLKVSWRTVRRRMAEPEAKEAREQGRLVGNAKLRSNMVRLTRLSNGVAGVMCKFLAINQLGMTDGGQPSVNVNVQNSVEVTSYDRIAARLDRGAERLRSRIIALAAAVGADPSPGANVGRGADDAPRAIEAPGSIAPAREA
jgi:hypothetical protein